MPRFVWPFIIEKVYLFLNRELVLKLLISLVSFFISFQILANPTVGTKLSQLVIKGDDGGKVVGGAWDSDQEIGGKVSIMFYVDPDEKDTNEALSAAIKAKKFPKDKIKSFGFVNMAATWLPNVIIGEIIKGKQKKYTDTIMVKDTNRVVVKNWKFADESSVVAIFGKDQKLLYYKAGAHSEEEIKNVLNIIETNL